MPIHVTALRYMKHFSVIIFSRYRSGLVFCGPGESPVLSHDTTLRGLGGTCSSVPSGLALGEGAQRTAFLAVTHQVSTTACPRSSHAPAFAVSTLSHVLGKLQNGL